LVGVLVMEGLIDMVGVTERQRDFLLSSLIFIF
jgi:hypothetical protein